MAVVKRPIDKENDAPLEGKCAICGEAESTAYWMASGTFFEVCKECALNKLPLLIADAVSGSRHFDSAGAHAALEVVAKSYWRGIAIQAMQKTAPSQQG